MKRLLYLIFFVATIASAQVTVTGTVTDPDTIVWANGTATFSLHNNTGIPPKLNGVPMTPAQLTVTAALNGSGAFTTNLSDNTHITPVGTQWAYQICSAATSPCQSFPLFTASGASLSLTTAISATIQAIRIPASYTTQAYADVEISPLPPPGGTYYNLQGQAIRFWNGTVWAAMGSGGGGGSPPNAPAGSIQAANPGVTGFTSDPGFLIDTTGHTLTSTANMVVNALSLTARNTYDPMDTRFSGGLAAAIAGTSGFTPTQVIQAAIDYGECQLQTHAIAAGGGINIPLPARGMNISQIKLWGGTSIGGDMNGIYATGPGFQHIDATKPMIISHGGSDTLVCGGTTYTPGAGSGVFIHNMGIAGMGNTSAGSQDIGIVLNGQASAVYQIWGAGNQFGAQAILNSGFNNFIFYAGYYGAQISGCASFTTGALPVSSSITPNECASVQDSSTDSEVHFVYASDAAEQLPGKGPGACYPGCAAIALGNNTQASHLFAQVSDVDISMQGTGAYATLIRIDATSREGMIIGGEGNIADNIIMDGVCLSSGLQAAYSAGTQTGCYGIRDNGQGDIVSNFAGGGGNSFFGQAYMECQLENGLVGFSAQGGLYTQGTSRGNPDNATDNDETFCGTFQGDQASSKVIFAAMSEQFANTSTVDVNNLTSVVINTTNPVTTIKGGIAGQQVTFRGIPGASIVPGGSSSTNIVTCTNLPEVFDSSGTKTVTFANKGGYRASGTTPNNQWREVCNTPNVSPLHVGYYGNATPSQPSMIDFYGNIMARKQNNALIDVSQLHGPAAPSGQYCFLQKNIFSDGYYTTSQLACTNVDLAHQTAGEVFTWQAPWVSSYELWLVSNTTTSGIPTGKYPAPAGGGALPLYWDGPTTIAAGGDSTLAPAAGINNTGMYIAPYGVLYQTYSNTQPTCDVLNRGRMWLVGGVSGNPDVLQNCLQVGTGTYQWQTVGGAGGVSTGVIAMGTSGGGLTNSHLNETANAGYDTFTQGIVVQDTSGNGANFVGTEGTQPSSAVGCGVAGNDCLWADSTQHQWLTSNNGGAISAMATIPTSSPITAGHCVMGGAGNDQLADAGAACGSGGGGFTPGTPTLQIDAGAGTTPTITLTAGASDVSGFVNITFGTCTGGLCPVPTTGIVDIRNSKFATGGFSPQLKCVIEPANVAAMALSNTQQLFTPVSQQTALKFTIISNTTAIAQSTGPYIYYYHCDFQ